jgi:hypothetical protein
MPKAGDDLPATLAIEVIKEEVKSNVTVCEGLVCTEWREDMGAELILALL